MSRRARAIGLVAAVGGMVVNLALGYDALAWAGYGVAMWLAASLVHDDSGEVLRLKGELAVARYEADLARSAADQAHADATAIAEQLTAARLELANARQPEPFGIAVYPPPWERGAHIRWVRRGGGV